jgi:putative Mn2+ efflux pump MntP
MSVAGTSTIIAGIIIFLIGYWFLGKSYGQTDCKDIPDTTNVNYGGGMAGIFIGIILMITGLVINFSTTTTTSTLDSTSSYYEPTTPTA